MILNEQEAKTKTCPFMSHRMPVEGYVDPILLVEKCQASGCMAWRWAPRKSPKDIQERKDWPHLPDTNPAEPEGYCGA